MAQSYFFDFAATSLLSTCSTVSLALAG